MYSDSACPTRRNDDDDAYVLHGQEGPREKHQRETRMRRPWNENITSVQELDLELVKRLRNLADEIERGVPTKYLHWALHGLTTWYRNELQMFVREILTEQAPPTFPFPGEGGKEVR